MSPDPRQVAVQTLLDVIASGSTLTSAWSRTEQRFRDRRDAGLARELCFGTLRWEPRLTALLNRLLDRPLKQRDQDIQVVLLLGLYQLIYTRVPSHAAVSESVKLAGSRGKPWAKGLVNGVLRRFDRNRRQLLREVDENEAVALAHDSRLMEVVQHCWPEDWRKILMANNEHPPMTLRVNRRRLDRQTYLRKLADAGIDACPAAHTQAGIVLDSPVDVTALPGFFDGLVSVQDAGAQLAAPLLRPGPGERVLDACAAPGGKAAHLLEHQPEMELVALDKDERRMERLQENLGRLGLEARIICADATSPDKWWDGRPFDRILLDAPCSGSGVIRRHPDIKLLRRTGDTGYLTAQQERLLSALWPLLAPGGTLLYATCSVLCEENDARIARFTASGQDARVQPIETAWGETMRFGRQVLPGENGMDGFYYSLLRKR